MTRVVARGVSDWWGESKSARARDWLWLVGSKGWALNYHVASWAVQCVLVFVM